MAHRSRTILALPLLVLTAACYHAVIETGARPSMEVIDVPWAMSFAWGLVPPPVVETARQCPNGVARVETRLSFMNQLVSVFTGGIVTPMHIRVTCATGRRAEASEDGPAVRLDRTAPPAEQQAVLSKALRDVGVGRALRVTFD